MAGAVIAGTLLGRRRLENWGATAEEIHPALLGDQLVPAPAITTTRAVTIDAPAEEVWRWLVQMGKGRGGMYSYDWLENLLGLGIHSADEIRDQWQHLAVDDRVVVVPPGVLGMKKGYSFPVAIVDPGQGHRAPPAPTRAPLGGRLVLCPRAQGR